MAIDYVHPKRQRKIILTADNPVTVIPGPEREWTDYADAIPRDISWSDFKADLIFDEASQAFVYRP